MEAARGANAVMLWAAPPSADERTYHAPRDLHHQLEQLFCDHVVVVVSESRAVRSMVFGLMRSVQGTITIERMVASALNNRGNVCL
jgi:hypothetical protein